MATQPAAITDFCLDTTNVNGGTLKIAPLSDVIQTGLLPNMPMARVWLNYYINQHAAMCKFVQDEVLGVGRVLSYNSTVTQPDFVNDFEGSWALLGTQSIGGVTVNHYHRTA